MSQTKTQKRMIGALRRENAQLRKANRELASIQGVMIACGPDATVFIADPVLKAMNCNVRPGARPEATFELIPARIELSQGPFNRTISANRMVRDQFEIKLVIRR